MIVSSPASVERGGPTVHGEQLRCLAGVASRWRLRYLVVFGSQARGYAGLHSDYDVAVKVGRGLAFVERGLLYTKLERCVDGARPTVHRRLGPHSRVGGASTREASLPLRGPVPPRVLRGPRPSHRRGSRPRTHPGALPEGDAACPRRPSS